MKKIVIPALLLLASLTLDAQSVTGQFGASFQSSLKTTGGSESLHQWGVWAGVMLEPFYPWPIYLESGLGATMCVAPDHTAHTYRLEIPLDVTWQWEPAPSFSMGPFVGAYGSYAMWVDGSYGAPEDLNRWSWGLMGGLSIRPGAFLLNIGYYRDMMPLRKADEALSDYFRVGHGIRVSIGWCF